MHQHMCQGREKTPTKPHTYSASHPRAAGNSCDVMGPSTALPTDTTLPCATHSLLRGVECSSVECSGSYWGNKTASLQAQLQPRHLHAAQPKPQMPSSHECDYTLTIMQAYETGVGPGGVHRFLCSHGSIRQAPSHDMTTDNTPGTLSRSLPAR